MTTVELRDATKRWPTAIVAESFRIDSGRRLAILGPSGSGKSTLLGMVGGSIEPDSGNVLFDGQSVLGVPPEKRNAAMVFQDHALFPFRTVAENVGYGLKIRKVPTPERRERVAEALRAVHLDGFGDRWPGDLSGGERQRVALARAVVVRPSVLLLDEPLNSLDPELRCGVRETINTLQRDLAMTTILVTHDRQDADELADEILTLSRPAVPETLQK